MDNSRLAISKRRSALLKWVLTFNFQKSLESIDSLPQTELLKHILNQIDSYFKIIDYKTLTVLQTCLQLSQYMILKLNFKGIVMSYCDSVDSMISQLLYVCVHCDKKEDFINKILKMEPQTQSILMKIISDTSSSMQQLKQLKEVLEKVDQLQNQNEELKTEIEVNQTQFEKYEVQIKELKKEMKLIINQNEAYRKQKAEVLKQLKITQFEDYLELYKRLSLEYEDLDSLFKRLNELYEKQKVQNEEYKKKIIEDNQFIYFLGNQSEQARAKWLTLKSIYASSPPQNIYEFDVNAPTPLSTRSMNVLAGKSVSNNSENQPPKKEQKQKPTEFIQSKQKNTLQQKVENMRLIEESQRLFEKCAKYKQIIKKLNTKNSDLEYSNEYLKSKIGDLQNVYSIMRIRYPA